MTDQPGSSNGFKLAIIIAVIGAVATIIAAVIGGIFDKKQEIVVHIDTPANASPAETTSLLVKIDAPREGQSVSCTEKARGAYLPQLADPIWPVVHVAGRYYPQDNQGKPAAQKDGAWSQTVHFGSCANKLQDAGVRFELLIVTTDADANQVFVDYLQQSKATGSFPGLESLPPGTTTWETIEVTRE